MAEAPVLMHAQDVRLPKAGSTFQWQVRAGESWAVMGRSGSGKTTLFELVGSKPTSAKGKTILYGSIFQDVEEFSRRATPQTLATQASGRGKATDAGEALNLLGLWDVRRTPLFELGAGHQAACRLLRPLLQPSDIVLLDLTLDWLDPWILPRVMRAFRVWLSRGRALLVATNRPDVAQHCSQSLVLGGKGTLYMGPTDVLMQRVETITVEASNSRRIQLIAEAFEVHIEEEAGGLRMTTPQGQELAARLLLEGYGVVRSIHTRTKNMAETLQELEDRGGLWYPPSL